MEGIGGRRARRNTCQDVPSDRSTAPGSDDNSKAGFVKESGRLNNDKNEQICDLMPNPMENPVILAKLFEVCDLSDLARYRLVNQQWYELSLTRWRKDMTLAIGLWGRLSWKNVSGLYDWEEEWKQLESKPYRNYKLHNITFSRPARRNISASATQTQVYSRDFTNMDAFWNKCGPTMVSLHLVAPRVTSIPSLTKVIFQKTPNLNYLRIFDADWRCGTHMGLEDSIRKLGGVRVQPNLKSLTICRFLSEEDLPIMWDLIFRHFPNIQELEFDPSEIASVLKTLETLDPPKMTLKSLNFSLYDARASQHMTRLVELGQLKLESLGFLMRCCEDAVSQSVLPKILELHGPSLKKLELANYLEYSPPYKNFPVIPLTSLTVLILKEIVFTNFQFLEQMPNLKIFHMCRSSSLEEMIAASRLDNIVLPRVTEFVVDNESFHRYRISQNVMRVLVKLMPNVVHHKAPLTAEAIQVICTNWKNLQSLDIIRWSMGSRGINDSAIAGSLSGEKNSIPNLTHLKYLQKVTIGEGAYLGDDSVYSGFLKLPHLHTLNVTRCELESASAEAIKTLRKKFVNVR